MNIISQLSDTEPPPICGGVFPRLYANHHNFTLGDLFKNIVTSLVDPLFPSGHFSCTFPTFFRHGVCLDNFLDWMNSTL